MAHDVNNIITVKQLLNNSINKDYFDYIKELIDKTVKDCNLLYTKVCYLIKLFLLYDSKQNNYKYNDYKFDEIFIRKCFKLVKTGKINDNNNNNKDLNNLTDRLFKFFNIYNLDDDNKFKFKKSDNIGSITHITDSLSRDIQTNITNNIILNFDKYLKEYTTINLKLKFKNIDNKTINLILNDLYLNTFYSDSIYHSWIKEQQKLIIPEFNDNIYVNNFKDGIDNHNKIFTEFIKKYIKNNQKLKNLIILNDDNRKKIINGIILYLINKSDTIEIEFIKYIDWINESKNNIIKEFNSSKPIDLDNELNKNPFKFITCMLFMNINLESNKSNKKYQIIPLRTNLTPKFIPINIHSFVDILDSKFLFEKTKNYYHNDTKNGFMLFDNYFNFDSKYIKNTIKKGFVFSGLIYTNGYMINYIFNSKKHNEKKNKFYSKGKEEIKFIKENIKNLFDEEKKDFLKKRSEEKEKNKKHNNELNKEKKIEIKKNEKEEYKKILQSINTELNVLNDDYKKKILKIEEEHYANLKKEFDKIDKTNKNSKEEMDKILNKFNDISPLLKK